MRTLKTLKPGQKGTRKLLTRFGPSLLCVRYRYDEDNREHLKTVELVVQGWSREREAECLRSRTPGARVGDVATQGVALRIEDLINLQREGSKAKPYQVRQVRRVLVRYGLGDIEDA